MTKKKPEQKPVPQNVFSRFLQLALGAFRGACRGDLDDQNVWAAKKPKRKSKKK
jgi:hypothetical protein